MKNLKIFVIAFVIVNLSFANMLPAVGLPTATSTLFSGSGNCAMCHSASGDILTTSIGRDISPVALWQSTMMANSAKDPFWQAKVSAEVAEHPALQSVIEDKCTTCHMPMGRTERVHTGADYFVFESGKADSLSMDGVSCTLCHQIQDINLGTKDSFSGKYEITDAHIIFGPYVSPVTAPMFNQTGYTPTHSTHIKNSEMCATCHTLFTPYVDDEGQVAGYFPEQTPYLEWENSIYPADSVQCQTCHMPAVDEAMKIATRPPWLADLRTPVWEHDFAGGNAFMNNLLKEHGVEIGVSATNAAFDTTLANTVRMLQQQTIGLSTESYITDDTLYVNLFLENLSGHKFPTGFPSRRAWIHVKVENDLAQTVFESGSWDADGEIVGLDEGYEPHHEVISSPDQVQIYQAIMQDVNGAVTYTLLRGAQYAKDNRIPPKGFTSMVSDYENIAIYGSAENDPDFNHDTFGQEGSGTDLVEYRIPVSDSDSEYTVTVNMYYQSISPEFVRDLVGHATPEVATFGSYYDKADNSPVLVKSHSFNITNPETDVNESDAIPQKTGLLGNYPNPFNASTVIEFDLVQQELVDLRICDLLGREVAVLATGRFSQGAHRVRWDGRDGSGHVAPSGIYIALFTSTSETDMLRMLLLK